MSRTYKQGVARLYFQGGPGVTLRMNPNAVNWNFKINTAVVETVGGRVVQVLGATLSDITVLGSFGESRGSVHVESRVYAERFLAKMKEMAAYQSRDASKHQGMHQPAIFSFPTKGWNFEVYIKDLSDPDGGGSVTHRPGKFSYDYQLTLFFHADISDTAHILGRSNGVIETKKDKAIASYINRIADGVGWHFTEYNGQGGTAQVVQDTLGRTSERNDAGGRNQGRRNMVADA